MDSSATDPGPFARRLRALREAAALTQEELAERAGLTSNGVGALERGERRRPYPHTVRMLAEALGLDDQQRAALAAAARHATRGTVESTGAPAPTTTAAGIPARATVSAPLLGRTAELSEVVDLLRTNEVRLITITGPGGVGKTRLALAAADVVALDFPDGVAVAELAPVRDADLVLPTVASALGLPQLGPEDVIAQLVGFLAGRRPLLLLDNVEHVLDAAPQLAELLARAPQLTVLATSRAPLRIRAEQEIPVPPLALPVASDPTAVLSSPAGQLFWERARAASPTFTVTRESAPLVADICRRLEGLPLALELAAAHARLLDPATLADRLEQALGTGRSRELPPRQQTMRAALDWSHALLTRQEQTLLGRLSVFAGGFTLSAAEKAAGSGIDVFTALTGLVEQSLVVAPGLDGRFRLLEPIRQYAATTLAADELGPLATAHGLVFVELAAQAQLGLWGPDQGAWLDRLESEHANLRAALGWWLDGSDTDHDGRGRAARLLGDSWLYWALRGHAGEGLGWLERIDHAGAPEADGDDHGASALVARAGLSYATGDLAGTSAAATAALEQARPTTPVVIMASALVLAASGAAFAGRATAATTYLAEAEKLDHDAGGWLLPHIRLLQGQLEVLGGDLDAARRTLDAAERLARRLASPFTLATVVNVQASLHRLVGRHAEALQCWTEAAALANEVGISWTQVYTLPGLADLAVRAGQPELAVRLYAAAANLSESTGLVVSFPPDVEAAARGIDLARRALDAQTFQQCWDSGRTLALQDVAELAATITPPPG